MCGCRSGRGRKGRRGLFAPKPLLKRVLDFVSVGEEHKNGYQEE